MEYKDVPPLTLRYNAAHCDDGRKLEGIGDEEPLSVLKIASEITNSGHMTKVIINYIAENVGALAFSKKECISPDEIISLILYIKIFNTINQIHQSPELGSILCDIHIAYSKIIFDGSDILNDLRFVLFQTTIYFLKHTTGTNDQFLEFAMKVQGDQSIEKTDEDALMFICEVLCKCSENNIAAIEQFKSYLQTVINQEETRSPFTFGLYIKVLTRCRSIKISTDDFYEIIHISIWYDINNTSPKLFSGVCSFLANYLENNNEMDINTGLKKELLKMVSKISIQQFNNNVFTILEYFAFHSHCIKKVLKKILWKIMTMEISSDYQKTSSCIILILLMGKKSYDEFDCFDGICDEIANAIDFLSINAVINLSIIIYDIAIEIDISDEMNDLIETLLQHLDVLKENDSSLSINNIYSNLNSIYDGD